MRLIALTRGRGRNKASYPLSTILTFSTCAGKRAYIFASVLLSRFVTQNYALKKIYSKKVLMYHKFHIYYVLELHHITVHISFVQTSCYLWDSLECTTRHAVNGNLCK